MNKPSSGYLKLLAVILPGVLLTLIPCPQGVTLNSWFILAIFISAITASMVGVAPIGLIAFITLALVPILGLAPLEKVLNSFSSTTIWIIVCAFMIARGLQKTGLGQRIAYYLVGILGRNALGLAYALGFSEMVIGSAMPSITARSGGIFFPISQGLCEVYGSQPGATAKKAGSFLMQLGNQTGCIVSSMFLTGMASNLIIASLAKEMFGIEVTWMSWFLVASLPGILCLLFIPYVLMRLEKPQITQDNKAKALIQQQIQKMGPMTSQECIMLCVFLGTLLFWVCSSFHATTIAMAAVAILLCTKVLSWEDITKNQTCWDCFIWVAALMQMATLATEGGLLTVVTNAVSPIAEALPGWLVFGGIIIVYLYSQYFFASLTAHIITLYIPFLLISLTAGVPPVLAAIVLGIFSNLCGGLTNYSAAHTPIWFSSGYVSQKTWWKSGFICSLINVTIFFSVGLVWWKILGMY